MQTAKSVQLTDGNGVNISPITDINSIYYETTDTNTNIVSRKNLYDSSAAFPIGVQISSAHDEPIQIKNTSISGEYDFMKLKWNDRIQASIDGNNIGDISIGSIRTENLPGTSYRKIVATNYNLSEILYQYVPKHAFDSSCRQLNIDISALNTSVQKVALWCNTSIGEAMSTVISGIDSSMNKVREKLADVSSDIIDYLKSSNNPIKDLNSSVVSLESSIGDISKDSIDGIVNIGVSIDTINSSLADISNNIKNIDSSISNINGSIGLLRNEIIKMNSSINDYSDRLSGNSQITLPVNQSLVPGMMYNVSYNQDNIFLPNNVKISSSTFTGSLILRANSSATFDGNIYEYIDDTENSQKLTGKCEIIVVDGGPKIKVTYMEDNNGNRANYDFVHTMFGDHYTFEGTDDVRNNVIENNIYDDPDNFVVIHADGENGCIENNTFGCGNSGYIQAPKVLNNIVGKNNNIMISTCANKDNEVLENNVIGNNSSINIVSSAPFEIKNSVIGNMCKVDSKSALTMENVVFDNNAKLQIDENIVKINDTIFEMMSDTSISGDGTLNIKGCIFGSGSNNKISFSDDNSLITDTYFQAQKNPYYPEEPNQSENNETSNSLDETENSTNMNSTSQSTDDELSE